MPLAEILLVSRLLGLVAGHQRLEIQADPSVRKVEVRRDGERVATLQKAPWQAAINFGEELAPHDLTVIAYDDEGRELGRDVQAINVARPPAELGVIVERTPDGKSKALIHWTHFAYIAPQSVVVKLDGRTISKSRSATSVPLGVFSDSAMHVLGVEVTFPDRIKSRKEIVFGGGFSEQMPAELTPVAVRQRTATPDRPANCFRAASTALPPAPIERGGGAARFIINGRFPMTKGTWRQGSDSLFSLHDNQIDIVNPVAIEIDRVGGHTFLFDSKTLAGQPSTRRLVRSAQPPVGTAQIADSIGAAALRTLRGGERRVLVLVVGDSMARDWSVHSPAKIRRYLRRVGVPFRIWSLNGPRPEIAELWGEEVRDVSTAASLLAATEDLRKELESQRVAWLPVGSVDAFRVVSSEDCAYAPLAGDGYALRPAVEPLSSSAAEPLTR